MKNIKRIFLLVMIIISSSAIEAYSKFSILLEIARKRDCMGFGICKFIVNIGDQEFTLWGRPEGNNGYASGDFNDDGRLELTFSKKSGLTKEAYDKYFSKGTFLVEDDYPVPGDMLKKMNHPEPYTVKAGIYPVKMIGDQLTVVF